MVPSPLHTKWVLFLPQLGWGQQVFAKEKTKSKHKVYFFPGLHIPDLIFISYVILIIFVRTVRRVSGEARNIAWDLLLQSSHFRMC